MNFNYNTKTLSFTSGKGGVGKTTLAANVAYRLSQSGKRVLIFDTDLGMAFTPMISASQWRRIISPTLKVSDYKAKDVVQSTDASGGVNTRVVERNPATVPVPNAEGGVDQRPNVSLEEEVVQAQVATYSAQANLKVLQVQDKLNKYLVDIQA